MSTNEEQETYDFYICGTDAIDAADRMWTDTRMEDARTFVIDGEHIYHVTGTDDCLTIALADEEPTP